MPSGRTLYFNWEKRHTRQIAQCAFAYSGRAEIITLDNLQKEAVELLNSSTGLPMMNRSAKLWCKAMHPRPMWPIHGRYICPQCMREFGVPWESQSGGRAGAAAVSDPATPKPPVWKVTPATLVGCASASTPPLRAP